MEADKKAGQALQNHGFKRLTQSVAFREKGNEIMKKIRSPNNLTKCYLLKIVITYKASTQPLFAKSLNEKSVTIDVLVQAKLLLVLF